MGQHGYNQGDLGWSELITPNATAALEFYSGLAGWEKKGEPMPGYHVLGIGEEMLCGITEPQLVDDTSPRWVPYITVNDLDAAVAKVESLGGTVIVPPTQLPENCGRVAVFKDPQGVVTGLAQYPRKSG